MAGAGYRALPFTADSRGRSSPRWVSPEGACPESRCCRYDDGVVRRRLPDRHLVWHGRDRFLGADRRQPRRRCVHCSRPAANGHPGRGGSRPSPRLLAGRSTGTSFWCGATASGPTTTAPPTTVAVTDPPFVPTVSVPAGLGPVEVATMFLGALAAGDGATACALLTAEEMTINFVEEADDVRPRLGPAGARPGRVLGERADHRRRDDVVAWAMRRRGSGRRLRLARAAGPPDDGCLSISIDNGEWRIEDLSNSIWNQAG